MLALAMLEWLSAPRHPDPVFERDGWRCAVPACSSRRNLHDHHVVFRSHGGGNGQGNRITVCAAHHLHGLHMGRIRATGTAPRAIVWEMPFGRLLGDRYLASATTHATPRE
ncbi:MAG: HNH endonuclease [Candidatus Binatia bacterium]